MKDFGLELRIPDFSPNSFFFKQSESELVRFFRKEQGRRIPEGANKLVHGGSVWRVLLNSL